MIVPYCIDLASVAPAHVGFIGTIPQQASGSLGHLAHIAAPRPDHLTDVQLLQAVGKQTHTARRGKHAESRVIRQIIVRDKGRQCHVDIGLQTGQSRCLFHKARNHGRRIASTYSAKTSTHMTPQILQLNPILIPAVNEELAARYQVHKYFEIEDQGAFLQQHGASIEASSLAVTPGSPARFWNNCRR